jgi:small nuclear ribonucleoprotein (snRNP)-like protein
MYCSYVSAQTDNLKVSLKNGVIIIGEMKEFDPTNHVTLMVSGIETKIPMSNVASVESIKEGSNTAIVNSNPSVRSSNEAGYYEITDKDAYPEMQPPLVQLACLFLLCLS